MTGFGKTVVTFIIILILSIFVFIFSRKEPTENITPPIETPQTTLKKFTDPNDVFFFEYNPLFEVTGGESALSENWTLNPKQKGLVLATVSTPRNYIPQTNFSEAKLKIGRSTDADSIKNCEVDTSGMNLKSEKVEVSQYPFSKFTLSDAGAGNYYDTVSYRGIVDGDCYMIEYTVHSTSIGAYSPEQGITEFDRAKITNDLEAIVKSLKFTISSD